MAKLNIEQAHALPLDEVKRRLQELADRLSAKYGIDAKWTSDREAKLKRTGVSGVSPPRRRAKVSLPLFSHSPATARRA